MIVVRYHREPWPASIQGVQADYWIDIDGKRVGYIKVDRAGRQSGTYTHWRAYDADGN